MAYAGQEDEIESEESQVEDDELYDLKDEEEKEELIDEIWCNLNRAKDQFSHWRQTAKKEEEFYAGDQWDESDREKLTSEGRPVITFNRTIKIINAVCGMELQNRQEVRYLPAERNDNGFADLLTNAARWVRAKCDAEDEESQAFQDVVKIGMGWIETRMDYESDLDGQIMIERISPFEMLWDPDAQKNNLSDSRWFARVKQISLKEFKEFWPGKEPEYGEFWEAPESGVHDASQELHYKYKTGEAANSNSKNSIAVIQYQYWERHLIYRYTDIDGIVKEATEEDFKKIKQILDVAGIRYTRQYKKIYKQCFVNGKTLLDRGDAPTNEFTFTPITGLRDKIKNEWFGLMRLLIDPQMWSNKWLSQLLHIINSNAKGGLLVEDGAFANPREAMQNWSRPDSITKLNPGGLNKIRDKNPPAFPDGIDRIFQYSLQAFQDVTGVNAETLGLVDRNQPGILEQQRKESVYGQLQQFFDALRHYRKDQGRLLANFIREYIAGSDEESSRLIRIVGEDGERFVPLIRDELNLKYDIVVGDSPTAPNQRERTASLIMSLIPLAQSAGMPIPPDIIEYMPLPEALIDKWKEMISQMNEPNPVQEELAQKMQQIDMILAELNIERQHLKNEELRTNIDLNTARSEKELALAADHFSKAQQTDEADVAKTLVDYYEVEREQSRKDAESIMKQKRSNLETIFKSI